MAKETRLFIRINKEDKETISNAAKDNDQTTSDYTVKAALEKAKRQKSKKDKN